jgi:hypothetical protein
MGSRARRWAPTNSARSSGDSGVTEADRQALSKTNAAAEQSCNGLAPGVTDLHRARQTSFEFQRFTTLNDAARDNQFSEMEHALVCAMYSRTTSCAAFQKKQMHPQTNSYHAKNKLESQ